MLFRYQAYEPLLRYTPDWSGVTPNVAESFEGDADSRVFTIRLRKGMRWSDGHPYTTDDIEVLVRHRAHRQAGRLLGQDHWKTNGKVGKLEIVDERPSRSLHEPNGFFPLLTAWANNDQTTRCPKHYLQQFHIDYNPKADELANSAASTAGSPHSRAPCGLQDDNTFFLNSSKRPCLNAWMFTIAPGENTERAIAVRNPYYWKVDTAGNQLPYLDRIVYQMVADPQVLLLKTMQGQIDMMDQYIATPNNKSVLYDAREKGGYRLLHADLDRSQRDVFHPQPQPQRRDQADAVPEPRFPRALSTAIDRQSLIDAVLVGQGAPAQPSIKKEDPLYNEQLATQFTSSMRRKANAMLDRIVPKRDAAGFRLDEKGRRLSIVFELDQSRAVFLDMFQLVIPMFKAVGIDAQMRPMDRSLWETRIRQGRDFDATAHQFGANGGIAAMLDPRYYVPTDANAMYAPGWQLWYRDPQEPECDRAAGTDEAATCALRQAEGDIRRSEARREVMKQILQGAADEFYVFGVSLPPDGYGVVKNNMRNVTKTMPNSFGWPTPAPTMPEQFFKA